MNKYNNWKSNFIELEINKDNEKEIRKIMSYFNRYAK